MDQEKVSQMYMYLYIYLYVLFDYEILEMIKCRKEVMKRDGMVLHLKFKLRSGAVRPIRRGNILESMEIFVKSRMWERKSQSVHC